MSRELDNSIAKNVGRLISEVYLSNGDIFAPPDGEIWKLDWDEINGSGGYQDVYSIVRWSNGNQEAGRWNLLQLAGWSYVLQSGKE